MRGYQWIFAALVAAGCGSVSDNGKATDGGGDPGDGGGGEIADASASGPDAVAFDATPPCAWSDPSLLANVNSDSPEAAPSLSEDARELYFVRYGADSSIYLATRDAPDQAFDPPEVVDAASDKDAFEYDPEISSSGLELFFRWDNADIRVVSRSSTASAWETPQLTGLSGQSPSISGDGKSLYFLDDDTVRVAERDTVDDSFGTPTDLMPAGGMNGIDISSDELKLLLSRGSSGFDGDNVVIAERSSTSDDFGTPVALENFTMEDDISTFLNASWNGDATQMVLTYQQTAEAPSAQIYIATCD